MKICFLIPDGVGIRNYLYSDVLKILNENGHEIIIWHSLDPKVITHVEDFLGFPLQSLHFEHKSDSLGVQLIREATKYARLKLNARKVSNPTIMDNWSSKGTFKSKVLYKLSEVFGGLLDSYEKVATTESWGFGLLKSSDNYKNALKNLQQMKPDLVFCTHQRVFTATASMLAAQDLGIKTATAIFSWDNLPKGRLPFRVGHYFVWSDYMKSEMAIYYPEIDPGKITVTGTPQFDFYSKTELILSKADFAKKYDLDPLKNWVCFSGNDSLTSPFDPQYLDQVGEALKNNEDIQLIFRPVPVEPSERFQSVLNLHPHIRKIIPEWVPGDHWGNYFPLYSDIQLLVNLVFHCKVVVNIGSTMALDFAAFGNVGLYLNYDQSAEAKTYWSVENTYNFQHFRSMEKLKAVGWINDVEDILPKIKVALAKPDLVAPDRSAWHKKIVQPSKHYSASKRITEALESL
ncbi:hypothetical protein [Algoriphagus sp.]|uniref:hypothetical protein n=1 Tax=Algoriphagus sp. TaxID=1872435 RepID=UPI003F707323